MYIKSIYIIEEVILGGLMSKGILLQILTLIAAVLLLSACSSDNNGSSNNNVLTNQTATILAYFPADYLEQENYMETVVDNTIGVEAKIGIVNYYTDNIVYGINDVNTKAYIMTGAGNIIHDETTNSDAKYYLIKYFTKN